MQTTLTDQEVMRYNRQIVLRKFGYEGQERLKAARVLIVGLGGLGCAAAQYLAASGVGSLVLIDFDNVSQSNLQRQILYTEADAGVAKVKAAYRRLTAINSRVRIDTVNAQLDDKKLNSWLISCNVVLDCSDNLSTREQLNRLCYNAKIPLVSGAAIRMEGQVTVFSWQKNEPCYHCISRQFSNSRLTGVEAGVMGPLVGVIGALQAMESLRLLAAYGKSVAGKLLIYDAMTLEFRQLKLMKNPACEVCGLRHPTALPGGKIREQSGVMPKRKP